MDVTLSVTAVSILPQKKGEGQAWISGQLRTGPVHWHWPGEARVVHSRDRRLGREHRMRGIYSGRPGSRTDSSHHRPFQSAQKPLLLRLLGSEDAALSDTKSSEGRTEDTDIPVVGEECGLLDEQR